MIRNKTQFKLEVLIFLISAGFLAATAVQAADAPPLSESVNPFYIATSARSSLTYEQWGSKVSKFGIKGTRTFPEWSWVQSGPNQWNWSYADTTLKIADANHMEITGLLFGGVPWAHEGVHEFPVNNLDAWSKYASAAVDRYKNRIHYWEVWNEGNAGFNDNHHTTSDYAKIVEAAYLAAKKADTNVQIGMSVASFDAPYLDQAILAEARDGKPNDFDYLCIHPYEVSDGLKDPDGEIPYLGMVHLLRQALKADAPDKAQSDIWITEVGRPLASDTTQKDAAVLLVKCYTMAIAEGIKRTFWFEAQDPVGEPPGWGILAQDGLPRSAAMSLKTMIKAMGETPRYQGWLALGADAEGYGFVFEGASGPVLVAWMPQGETDHSITFKSDVIVTNSLDGMSTTLKAGQSLNLSDSPMFIEHLPADLVAEAQSNDVKYFPWGGDYTGAASVSLQLGPKSVSKGIMQMGRKGTPVYSFPDGSTGIKMEGNAYATFYTHPTYASFKTSDYYIRITVRRLGPGGAGMNLMYEVADSQGQQAYKNKGEWFSLTDAAGWQTHTWHVTDACFSKMWGYDFDFHPEQSIPFVIGKVEVSAVPFP